MADSSDRLIAAVDNLAAESLEQLGSREMHALLYDLRCQILEKSARLEAISAAFYALSSNDFLPKEMQLALNGIIMVCQQAQLTLPLLGNEYVRLLRVLDELTHDAVIICRRLIIAEEKKKATPLGDNDQDSNGSIAKLDTRPPGDSSGSTVNVEHAAENTDHEFCSTSTCITKED